MPLSDLPSEIILEIADQLPIGGISALSRTNRLFYNLLNGYLYRRDVTRISFALLFGDLETAVPRAIIATLMRAAIPEVAKLLLES